MQSQFFFVAKLPVFGHNSEIAMQPSVPSRSCSIIMRPVLDQLPRTSKSSSTRDHPKGPQLIRPDITPMNLETSHQRTLYHRLLLQNKAAIIHVANCFRKLLQQSG
jgi:hypothetical protein